MEEIVAKLGGKAGIGRGRDGDGVREGRRRHEPEVKAPEPVTANGQGCVVEREHRRGFGQMAGLSRCGRGCSPTPRMALPWAR